jgi:hypothetical protein
VSLFAPKLPADEWRAEMARVEKRRPDLRIVDKRPDPQMFRWVSLSDLIPIKEG